MIIVDEGHHGPAKTYRPTIDYFTPEFLLGMTATPDRMDLKNIREIFGPEVFSLPLEVALTKGYLTKVKYKLLTDEIVEKRLKGLKTIKTKQGRLRLRDLNRLFAIPKRDRKVVRLIRNHTAGVKTPRIMVFCPSIAYCEWLQGLWPGSITAHSDMSDKVRKERLAQYRSGEVSVILTVDAFNEGIDVPDANVIVFLRSTASFTVFFQQLGRGLRKAKGKQEVLVLDLVGNCKRLEILRRLEQSVKGIRGPREELKEVEVSFRLEFAAVAQEVLDLVTRIRSRLDDAQLIANLQDLGERLGRTPTLEDVGEASHTGLCASTRVYYSRFGSFPAALRAAGFDAKDAGERRSWDQLIRELKTLGQSLGRTPRKLDIDAACKRGESASSTTYSGVFGSIPEALKAAGFKPNMVMRKRTRRQLVGEMKALARRLGRTPTTQDVGRACKQGSCGSVQQYEREFGSFNDAVRAAGLKPNVIVSTHRTRLTMIAELKALGTKLGRTPTTKDVGVASKSGDCAALSAYYTEFGSYSEALRKSGFKLNLEHRTRKQLIADMKTLARRLGRTPNSMDLAAASKSGECCSIGPYMREFGTFNGALEAAGFTPNKVERPPREQLITALKALAQKLGRTPTTSDVSEQPRSTIASVGSYSKEFGSFTEALRAAGLEPN